MAKSVNKTVSPLLLKHFGNTEQSDVPEKQKKICEDCGLDSLLHLARMPHVKVQGLALAVINSLVERENGDISIESEEGFTPLVELTKFAEDDIQREAVWALAILASNNSCQARIEQEVGWHNFRKYAASPVPEIQAGTAILLGNLALEKRNQENMMVKGVPLLLNMLSDTKDHKVRRAVVTALSNVSIIEGYGAKDVWLDKGIDLMMPFIEQGDDMQLQIGALNTIANVCNHDKSVDLKRKVADIGGIGRLVPLLESQDEMIVKLAAMTIANMASDDNHRNIMHGLHIEESLIRLLDSRDEEVQLGVTMAINALADNNATAKELRVRRAAEPLKELIHITKDRDIAKEAKEALSKIAPDEFASLNLRREVSYTGSTYTENSEDSYSASYNSEDDSGGSDEERIYRSKGRIATESDTESETRGVRKNHSASFKFEEARRIEEQRRIRDEKLAKERILLAVERADIAKKKAEEDKRVNEEKKLLEVARQQSEEEMKRYQEEKQIEAQSLRAEAAERRMEIEGDEKVSEKEKFSVVEPTTRKIEIRPPASFMSVALTIANNDLSAMPTSPEGSKSSASNSISNSSEVERRWLEEEHRKQDLEDETHKKKVAVESKKREDDRRKIEEDEFKRREALEERRRADAEEFHVDEAARSQGKSSRRSRSGSMDSVIIPKNPAKNLVSLLQDAKHKKSVTHDALHALENFASRTDSEQLLFGEDVIAILVYIIYFYPETEYADIVMLSLYLLAILARYQVKSQLAIRRARGGDQVVRLLLSPVEGVRRNAALALGAYTLNNKSVQAEVIRAIPILVRTLENHQNPPATLRTVAACLASIADSNAANQTLVIEAGGLRAAIVLCPTNKHYIRSCLNLVSAVVSHNVSAQNKVILEYPRFLAELLATLSSPETVEYKDAVTNALVELVKKNHRVQQGLYHAEGVTKLVPLLEGFRVAGEEEPRRVRVFVNTVYLLYTLVRLAKYTTKVRAELIRLNVAEKIKPMCTAKSRHLSEVSQNLTKAIDGRR